MSNAIAENYAEYMAFVGKYLAQIPDLDICQVGRNLEMARIHYKDDYITMFQEHIMDQKGLLGMMVMCTQAVLLTEIEARNKKREAQYDSED
jgi:hypothetical protein